MTVQKDAEEILILIYQRYIETNQTMSNQEVTTETNWESGKVERALRYLNQKGFVDTISTFGNTIIKRITADGIDVIENEDKFRRNFNHTIDLGVYKFSWGAEEK